MSSDAKDVFDYIVVGAGTAGCVVANRLSDDPSVRVCMIEAGPPDSNRLIHVPLGVMWLINHPKLDWRFSTPPQPGAAGRVLPVPRGRTLGGSSSTNGMVYTRGHPKDYDDWAAAGNTGWSFREILPYFRRSEDNANWRHSVFHGTEGPFSVTNLDSYNKLCEVLFEAAESLGMSRTTDFCGPTNEGFNIRQAAIRKGRRESTATAFLTPIRGRKNLSVITEAQVARVLLDGRRATGIEYVTDGAIQHLGARREVVLAAGVIGSPMLLMLSGIGDGEELRRHGISVVHSLPGVGRNLQEHISTPIRYSSPTTVPYGLSLRSLPWVGWSFVEYFLFRRGLLANNIIHAGGFVKSDPALDRPDLQFILEPGSRSKDGKGGWGHGFGLTTLVLRPKSRGRLTLSGPDFRAAPVIDMRFLSEKDDVDLAVHGLKLARRILMAPAFDPYRGEEKQPGVDVQSDAALEDYLRHFAVTGFHCSGTCKMGTDADAVVDPELKVRGIEGLRVADASIMPIIIGGNTMAPVIMIGEKASDMIRGLPPMPPEDRIEDRV